MSDANYRTADPSHEGQPSSIPSEQDVGNLIEEVRSLAEEVRSGQINQRSIEARLTAAEERAQTAEHLLRQLYHSVINHLRTVERDPQVISAKEPEWAGDATKAA